MAGNKASNSLVNPKLGVPCAYLLQEGQVLGKCVRCGIETLLHCGNCKRTYTAWFFFLSNQRIWLAFSRLLSKSWRYVNVEVWIGEEYH